MCPSPMPNQPRNNRLHPREGTGLPVEPPAIELEFSAAKDLEKLHLAARVISSLDGEPEIFIDALDVLLTVGVQEPTNPFPAAALEQALTTRARILETEPVSEWRTKLRKQLDLIITTRTACGDGVEFLSDLLLQSPLLEARTVGLELVRSKSALPFFIGTAVKLLEDSEPRIRARAANVIVDAVTSEQVSSTDFPALSEAVVRYELRSGYIKDSYFVVAETVANPCFDGSRQSVTNSLLFSDAITTDPAIIVKEEITRAKLNSPTPGPLNWNNIKLLLQTTYARCDQKLLLDLVREYPELLISLGNNDTIATELALDDLVYEALQTRQKLSSSEVAELALIALKKPRHTELKFLGEEYRSATEVNYGSTLKKPIGIYLCNQLQEPDLAFSRQLLKREFPGPEWAWPIVGLFRSYFSSKANSLRIPVAIKMLTQTGLPSDLVLLRKVLRSTNTEHQMQAAVALGFEDPQAREILLQADNLPQTAALYFDGTITGRQVCSLQEKETTEFFRACIRTLASRGQRDSYHKELDHLCSAMVGSINSGKAPEVIKVFTAMLRFPSQDLAFGLRGLRLIEWENQPVATCQLALKAIQDAGRMSGSLEVERQGLCELLEVLIPQGPSH